MKSSGFQGESLRRVRSHVEDLVPGCKIAETEVTDKGRSYFILKVTWGVHFIDIYIYDDGDLGFKAENHKWYSLEIWDEKNDQKRIERFVKMLDKHLVVP